MSSIPGLGIDEWGWHDEERTISVEGVDHPVLLSPAGGDFGSLQVQIGDEIATISCEYDESTWMGGKDGIHMEPPFYLAAEIPGEGDLGAGAWQLSAWIISRLLAAGQSGG